MEQLLIALSYGPKAAVREIYHAIGQLPMSRYDVVTWSSMLEGIGDEESANMIETKAKESVDRPQLKLSAQVIRERIEKTRQDSTWNSEKYCNETLMFWRVCASYPQHHLFFLNYTIVAERMLKHGNTISQELLEEKLRYYTQIPDEYAEAFLPGVFYNIASLMIAQDREKAKHVLNQYVLRNKNRYGARAVSDILKFHELQDTSISK